MGGFRHERKLWFSHLSLVEERIPYAGDWLYDISRAMQFKIDTDLLHLANVYVAQLRGISFPETIPP